MSKKKASTNANSIQKADTVVEIQASSSDAQEPTNWQIGTPVVAGFGDEADDNTENDAAPSDPYAEYVEMDERSKRRRERPSVEEDPEAPVDDEFLNDMRGEPADWPTDYE